VTEGASNESTPKGWQARWYLWDGGFLTMGRGGPGVVPRHSHHAIQIVIGLDGAVGINGPDEQWRSYPGVIVGADVPHEFNPLGSLVAVLLVDPETHEGRWIERSLRGPVEEIAASRLEPCARALRMIWDEPMDAAETSRHIHAAVRALCAGPPPPRPMDARVLRALEVIRRMDTARLSLEEVAGAVFLSPSRFAHLFSDEVGLPFRRYVLWRRLTRALLAVGRGSTLSAAAHASGFSDSAHLTRACYQMLGQSPSFLLKAGEFYEIPAPFEVPVVAP
jgi:AraC-like DNA-binding protein